MPQQKEVNKNFTFNPNYPEGMSIFPRRTKPAFLETLIRSTVADSTPKSVYLFTKDGGMRRISSIMFQAARESKDPTRFVEDIAHLASRSQEVIIFLEPTSK